MFLSQTTLEALRISIYSTIGLTNELFSKAYSFKYVLSAKWNQDCVEVGESYYKIFLLFTDL